MTIHRMMLKKGENNDKQSNASTNLALLDCLDWNMVRVED